MRKNLINYKYAIVIITAVFVLALIADFNPEKTYAGGPGLYCWCVDQVWDTYYYEPVIMQCFPFNYDCIHCRITTVYRMCLMSG